MRRIILLSGLLMATGLSATAYSQTKTVTNADLAKYRQKRLAAERELRENYEALGFSSPEERQERLEKSRIEKARIVEELRRRDSYARSDYSQSTGSRGAARGNPNPSFIDYGGSYAPSYLYYRFYNPYRRGYPQRYRRHSGRYINTQPGRFRTFRRMWRNAVRGSTGRQRSRRR